MPITITRPSGTNVGVMNPGDTIYVKGDENTTGSLRFHAHVKPDGLLAIFAEQCIDGQLFLVDLQAQEAVTDDLAGVVIVDDNGGDVVTSLLPGPVN